MKKLILMSAALTFPAATVLLMTQAEAQGPTQTYIVRGAGAIDYSNAKPQPLPQVDLPPPTGQTLAAPVFPGAPGGSLGAVGTGTLSPVRIAPTVPDATPPQSGSLTPFDFGAAQLPFSTYRVNGYSATDTLNYPFRASGILFFTEGSQGFYCSASLVKKGIVVTAAHCVSNYGKGQFYSNWQYIPAYDNGSAPYGTWTAQSATVLTSYLNGSDSCAQSGVVCQDDVAVLTLNPSSSGALPGTATGFLAYGYNGYSYASGKSLVQVAQLGYPKALDGGTRMQRNDAQGSVNGNLSNNTVIGTLMTEGSSGGPWIVNFGQPPVATVAFGNAPSHNVVVGVTSWVTTSSNYAYKREGAAPFTSDNIVVLINQVCGATPGNC